MWGLLRLLEVKLVAVIKYNFPWQTRDSDGMKGCISIHHRFQIPNVQNHHSAPLDPGCFRPMTIQGKYLPRKPGRTFACLVKEWCVSSEERYHFSFCPSMERLQNQGLGITDQKSPPWTRVGSSQGELCWSPNKRKGGESTLVAQRPPWSMWFTQVGGGVKRYWTGATGHGPSWWSPMSCLVLCKVVFLLGINSHCSNERTAESFWWFFPGAKDGGSIFLSTVVLLVCDLCLEQRDASMRGIEICTALCPTLAPQLFQYISHRPRALS